MEIWYNILGAFYYICKNLFQKIVIWESLTHLIQWDILILDKDIKIIVLLKSP
jgi:hypothetical protein